MIGQTKNTVTEENKDIHTKSTSSEGDIKHQAISTVKHALIAQEDALDMAEAANSPQHTREGHTALVYMQKGNPIN